MATKTFSLAILVTFSVLISTSYAQQTPTTTTTSSCSASMLSSFTPCMNFLTGSTSTSGNSPTRECCTSLKSLMSNSGDCLCQILTAGVPFKIPINRTLAISLPKACKQPGVPVQCKTSVASPLPAPGPAAFVPSGSSAGTASGTIPADTPTLAPVSETTPSTITGSETPATNTAVTGGSKLSSATDLNLSPLFLFSVAITVIIQCF